MFLFSLFCYSESILPVCFQVFIFFLKKSPLRFLPLKIETYKERDRERKRQRETERDRDREEERHLKKWRNWRNYRKEKRAGKLCPLHFVILPFIYIVIIVYFHNCFPLSSFFLYYWQSLVRLCLLFYTLQPFPICTIFEYYTKIYLYQKHTPPTI